MRPLIQFSHRHRQRGAVLFVSLILLLILTLIGITAARMQTGEESMARNENNHQLALQSAEAALRSGESLTYNYGPADYAANSNGLYELTSETQGGARSSIADTISWTAPGTSSIQVTTPILTNAPASPQNAQILIESLPPVAVSTICSNGYGAGADCTIYRVTSHAAGADGTANATLQSTFRTPPPHS